MSLPKRAVVSVLPSFGMFQTLRPKRTAAQVAFAALLAGAASGCAGGEEAIYTGDGIDGGRAEETGNETSDSGTTGSTVHEDASTPKADAGPSETDSGSDASVDAGPTGAPVGFPCTKSDDCASGECKDVVSGGSGSICVARCTAQADCAANYFCDPETPGATAGFCVPRSPSHCKTCSANNECGSLSEVCATAPGDAAKACQVDCSIAGNAACPADFTCTATTLDGAPAKVCRPNGGLGCLDSLGGFCDRVATPQTCGRSNTAGTCVGQRTCLTASNRYGSCAATAPVCKATCSATDPAGCNTSYCPEAVSGPANCGTCGNACPGLGKANVNVACNSPTCTFSCKGETYNVDNDKATGCETVESTTGNHISTSATNVGDKDCRNGQSSSDPNISGQLTSDSDLHENGAINGFDAVTGSAPDYYKIQATGGGIWCTNDIGLTLTVSGSTHKECYQLEVQTNRGTHTCTTGAAGTCNIDRSNSEYDDDTTIIIVVSKRNIAGCLANEARETVSYTVKGHL